MKEYSRQGEREVILERKQAVLLFAGGALALILVFVLGVLFGRNLANRKLAQEQAQVAKQAAFPQGPQSLPGATAAALPEIGATVQTAKSPVASGDTILQKIRAQQPPSRLTGPAKGSTAKPTIAVKPASTTPTTTKPTTTTPIATKPPATTKPATQPLPNFAIQVAAFPDQASADDLLKKLKADKWDVYSVPTQIPGKGIFQRVYVGRYSTRVQADKAIVIFKSKEPDHQDAFIRNLE